MVNPARMLVVGDDFFFRTQAVAKPSCCSCSMAESDEEVIFVERLLSLADAAFSTPERLPKLSPNSSERAVPKRRSLRVITRRYAQPSVLIGTSRRK